MIYLPSINNPWFYRPILIKSLAFLLISTDTRFIICWFLCNYLFVIVPMLHDSHYIPILMHPWFIWMKNSHNSSTLKLSGILHDQSTSHFYLSWWDIMELYVLLSLSVRYFPNHPSNIPMCRRYVLTFVSTLIITIELVLIWSVILP